MRLIDKAVRMAAAAEESDNFVRKNTAVAREKLVGDGVAAERAELLALARIFDVAPERFGSGLHDELFEATGIWDTEEQLADVYIAQHAFTYTEGLWGTEAPEAFRRQIDGTDVVMRTMTRRGALQGRAHYSGGMLSLVTKVVSGKEPDYYLSDVRSVGEERVLSARDAVRLDLRATLLNNKWITAQMQQKRGGAAKMAGMVWHTLGFRINSSQTISDDVWEQIVDIYLRDRRDLNIREWLETRHPEVFQEMTSMLLEAVRKDYWQPDASMVTEIAAAYAKSVARDGLEIDENAKLDQFVRDRLRSPAEVAPGEAIPAELLAAYEARLDPTEPTAESPGEETAPAEQVTGNRLVEANEPPQATEEDTSNRVLLFALLVAAVLVAGGYF